MAFAKITDIDSKKYTPVATRSYLLVGKIAKKKQSEGVRFLVKKYRLLFRRFCPLGYHIKQ